MRDLLIIAIRFPPAALAARPLTESYREWLAHLDPAIEPDDAEDQGQRFTYLMRYGNDGPPRVTSARLDPDGTVLLLDVQLPTDTPTGIPVARPRRSGSASCCSRPASDRRCSLPHLATRLARTSRGLLSRGCHRHTTAPAISSPGPWCVTRAVGAVSRAGLP
jgi:hypothetical protein